MREKYRSVKLFDDIVNLLAYGIPTACGIDGKCHPQLVVEADGSAYPCDFYCLDAFRMGNLAEQSLQTVLSNPTAAAFLTRPHCQPMLCKSCSYLRLCGGGCKRMQRQVCCSINDKACGYQQFLAEHLVTLQKIAIQQMQQGRYRRIMKSEKANAAGKAHLLVKDKIHP